MDQVRFDIRNREALYEPPPETDTEAWEEYINDQKDANKYKDYSKVSDIILFDSKGYHKSESFDHKLLDSIPSSIKHL